MPTSAAMRFEILRRDGFRCTYCGASSADAVLHVDHIVPESLGGPSTPDNLATACEPCNLGKAGRTLDDSTVAQVEQRTAEWALAIQQALDESRQEHQQREENAVRFSQMWNDWTPTPELGDDYPETINRFLAFGLDWQTIEYLVAVSMRSRARSTWLYFCGCCNRRIDDIRDRAMEIMEHDDGS